MKGKMDYHDDLGGELSSIDIIESPIDPAVQKEYQDLSDSIDFGKVNYVEILAEADKLFVRSVAIEEKKRTLILLAHLRTIESAKILEKYLKNSEGILKDWAALSLKECRMFVENVFLSDGGGFISTGLGGKGNKLRYYFIVSKRQGRPLTGVQEEAVQEAFKASSDEYRSEIEGITSGSNYVMIGILIPMDIAVGVVIEEGIRRCNRTEEFLLNEYYVTNVKKPTEEEISRYLKDIRQHKK
jgi:hypothetical protein